MHVEPHVRETKLGLLERIGSSKAKTTPSPSLLTVSQPERELTNEKNDGAWSDRTESQTGLLGVTVGKYLTSLSLRFLRCKNGVTVPTL